MNELAQCSRSPRWEELEELRYLNKVIAETLRWNPPVPGSLPRVAPEGGAMLGGYRIPGGTIVDTQAYTFHRDPTIWTAPKRFDPTRWDSPSQAMREHSMPFGGPARVCIGQNVARLELLHAVATFRECPNAELASTATPESMNFVDYFVVKPAGDKLEIILK